MESDPFKLALSGAQMGTWHIDLNTQKVTTSETAAAIIGTAQQNEDIFSLIGRLLHPDDVERVNRLWQTAAASGAPYADEFRIRREDGEVRWIFSRGKSTFGADGVALYFSGMIGDVTEQKLAALALIEERHKLNTVFVESSVAMCLLRGADFVFEKVNPKFRQSLGDRDFEGKSFREGLPELVDQPFHERLKRVFESGRTFVGEEVPAFIIRHAGGQPEESYWNLTYARINDSEGSPYGVYIVGADVTESVLARRKLRASQERLSIAIAVAKVGFFDWDILHDRVIYSEQMQSDWKIEDSSTLEEALARVHPGDRVRVSAEIEESMRLNKPFWSEYRVQWPDGTARWVEAQGSVSYDLENKPLRFFGTSRDISERKRAESQLVAEQHKLEAIFRESPAAMTLWRGRELIFEKVNPEYQKIFGQRELVGRPLMEALPEFDGQPFKELLLQVLESGAPFIGREVLAQIPRAIDGKLEDRYYDFSYVRVDDAEGRPYGVYDHAVDVTERVAAREHLAKAKEEAELANQTKSAFLANMSHEIRTPLGAILGFTDLLRDRNLEPREREQFLDTISRNGKALTRIIDDILDLAKVESGRLEVEEIEFSFLELMDDVLDLFRERARSKGIYLRLHVDEKVPPKIISDPTRLRQIFINIIGNAVKFTNKGGVSVRVEIFASAEHASEFHVSVRDTGVGIEAEQKARLFQPFMQADNTMTRKFGGTGLGLALSNRLAKALGGEIVIAESTREGSRFLISFAATLAEPNGEKLSAAKVSSDLSGLRLGGLQILLADDSVDNQMLLQRILTKHGASVDTAANGLDAFRKGVNGPYDVILMDIQMPGLDGYEATRLLREAGFKKPILALTAHAMAEERARSRAAGCDGHLTKPVNQPELLAMVETLVGHSLIEERRGL